MTGFIVNTVRIRDIEPRIVKDIAPSADCLSDLNKLIILRKKEVNDRNSGIFLMIFHIREEYIIR